MDLYQYSDHMPALNILMMLPQSEPCGRNTKARIDQKATVRTQIDRQVKKIQYHMLKQDERYHGELLTELT
jgi:hypothetical protein